ncbi:MAG: NAD-dependent epimerase/dehydratase family protein [Thermoguttaceae bacterium]|nr:NAD-dependent epimerase/dehydratase family protein [Thermoguttaceae bacterium]
MSETYFVTGATGFIGRSLTRRLLESGARVKCLVRTAAKADWLAGTPNVEIINGDLRDGAALARGVEGVDGVFHVAGLTREVRRGEFMEVNCGCTLDLARYCVRSGRRPTLVVVSSLSCSGIARKGDALSGESGERLYDLCRRKRETDYPRPISAYGRSKFAAEQNLQDYSEKLPITIVRPSYVFGEWDMESRQLYSMAKRHGAFVVPGWKDRYFSFIYIQDLVDVLIAAMTRGERLTPLSLESTSEPSAKAKFCSGKGVYFATAPEPILFSEFGQMVGRAFDRGRVRVFRIPPVGVVGAGVFGECYKALKHKSMAMDFNKSYEALHGPWICSGEKAKDQLGAAISPELESKFRRVALWYDNQGLI